MADNHQQHSHGATHPTWYLHAADYHSSLRISSGTTLGCSQDGELTFTAEGAGDAVRFDIIEHKLWVTRLVGDALLDDQPVHRYAQVPGRARLTIGSLRVRISSDLEALPEAPIVLPEPRREIRPPAATGKDAARIETPVEPPPVTASRAPVAAPASRDNPAYGPLTAFVCALLLIVGAATWWFSSGREQMEHAATPTQANTIALPTSEAQQEREADPIEQSAPHTPQPAPQQTAERDPEPIETDVNDLPEVTYTSTPLALTEAQVQRITRLEQRLERQLADGYLTLPTGDNAVATARLLLQLDPGHAGAMDAMSESAQRLLSAALEAQASGMAYEARNLIEEILAFHPTHAGALQAWADIQRQP